MIGREAKDYAADEGIPILRTEIYSRVAYAELLTVGRTIFEWARGSSAAREIERLTKELLKFDEQRNHSASAKKPARRPTPEEISAFEETGRAIAREQKITAKAERREHRKAETQRTRKHGNRESSKSAFTGRREPQLRKPAWRNCRNPRTRKAAMPQTQKHRKRKRRCG